MGRVTECGLCRGVCMWRVGDGCPQYFVLGWVDFREMGKRVDFFCTVILRKWQEIGWLLRSMYKLKERHFRYALPLL